ncbi:uncharacterized protein KRP23_11212 [Phytophthora ramorum]|uniref:uncharacterized protein n=1 Tax=Phytophthora ramorum TaxID=164328 RepID=UPI0030A2264E|nr:hypothetical protein KRP23_11212 [Phytophthora ramorum]
MADAYQFSLERPHLSLSPSNGIADCKSTQECFTTFTALLDAAHSVEINASPPTTKCDATPVPTVSSVVRRRLRNRESCRKTRLKRKLQQHALDLLIRERQERNGYLKQLSCELRADDTNDGMVSYGSSQQRDREELFRELAVKSLHYALVDPEYSGWQDNNDEMSSCISTSTSEKKRKSEPAGHSETRRTTRLRRARDSDVSAAPRSDSATAQASLIKQWRPLVDGLQNVDLKLHRMEEIDLGAGTLERSCYWKFVGVNSVEVQRDGEIAAVAVTGTTCVRFQGIQVQSVNICVVRRDCNVPIDLNPRAERST